MSHLTLQQSTELVNNGNCVLELKDGIYQQHKFNGILDGNNYFIITPSQADLKLTKDSTLEECKVAFTNYFINHQDYKGKAPTFEYLNLW
jgi:hypothetical protein